MISWLTFLLELVNRYSRDVPDSESSQTALHELLPVHQPAPVHVQGGEEGLGADGSLSLGEKCGQ